MYGHPKHVKKMAKALKPAPTSAQIAQAELMCSAKKSKRDFLASQLPLFERDSFAVTPAPISPFGESATGRSPAIRKELK